MRKVKSTEEIELTKLLALVSEKLHERFKNLRSAFRFLDTNHSQSISLNEFAQAIDHLRLKLSFEDIVKLYRFIDKEGKGEIGYDEFTLLTEEKWRGIDPFQAMQANIAKVEARKKSQEDKKVDCLAELDSLQTEIERLARLEEMAMNRGKGFFRGSQ